MAQGKRLTCPLCRDSSFFTFEQIEAAGGNIDCGNHTAWITMIDLSELMALFGNPVISVDKEGEISECLSQSSST